MIALVLCAWASACSGGPPLAAAGPNPRSRGGERVAEPPPPARPEHVLSAPGCVWVDGQWLWDYGAQRWTWIAGGLYFAPPNCHHAPPAWQWAKHSSDQAASLTWWAGGWFPDDAEVASCNVKACQ